MKTYSLFSSEKNKPKSQIPDMRSRIVGIDTKVPVLDGSRVPYIYLDNAASTPVLREVLDTINDFMPWYSSVHRGSGFKSKLATEIYEQSRQIVAEFFGANSNDHVVIFGKNTTEAINKLSYRLRLKKDDVVLVGLTEHHSNDLPWRRMAKVCRIKVDSQGRLLDESLDLLLDKYRHRIKLVAITGGSNVTGYTPDIHAIAAKVHKAGAQILVDCAQLAPHRKVSIRPLSDPGHLDYISVSAHKMYAPFGTGALIGRRDTFEIGAPELCGGGTINLVTEDRVEWTAPPDRDEAGSPNVVGALAFAKALNCLTDISMHSIAEHEADITAYTLDKLSDIEGVEVHGDTVSENTTNRLGVIPLNISGVPHSLAAEILGTEWGIGVRDGCFCAHPYVTHILDLNEAEIRRFQKDMTEGNRRQIPGLVRVSFGMYNSLEEVDVLVDAIKNIAAGNYSGQYVQDTEEGAYSAIGWKPALDQYFKL